MSNRTGLGLLETAVLRVVGRLSGPALEYVRCSDVLDALETEGFGASYLYRVVQDLAVWWRLHLPLLNGQGNFGSPGNDPAADATYTEVRLSPIGRLALAAENGQTGPLPLALIEGTLYRGGRIPPFDPHHVTDTLTRLLHTTDPFSDAELDLLVGAPALPTGGTVDGDLSTLLHGEPAEMRMSCRITHLEREGRQVLEITGFPLGVDVDLMLQCIADRARYPDDRRGGGTRYLADIQDHTSGRLPGIRMHAILRTDADPAEAEAWLRTVWPVSIDQTWQLPAPMADRLRAAAQTIAVQPGGLRQLRALL
ncbi:hypothetical protein GCM10025783_30510 [Amnibacterium soli]|uniref:DNA topoisomerase (ATP-hydrolyzing) n=1 Tax=Amnibacterium soli TaxID=1282736 RepID=A0ABP8ZFP1_9MICO